MSEVVGATEGAGVTVGCGERKTAVAEALSTTTKTSLRLNARSSAKAVDSRAVSTLLSRHGDTVTHSTAARDVVTRKVTFQPKPGPFLVTTSLAKNLNSSAPPGSAPDATRVSCG